MEQPFTQAVCTFDYVYRFQIFVTCVCANPIDTGFWEVWAKLIDIRNKQKTSDPSDPSNCNNPVITLDPLGHDPSD